LGIAGVALAPAPEAPLPEPPPPELPLDVEPLAPLPVAVVVLCVAPVSLQYVGSWLQTWFVEVPDVWAATGDVANNKAISSASLMSNLAQSSAAPSDTST
jgi:hypothetical protein